MANTYCHEAHCDLANKEKNSNKLLVISNYALYVLIALAATWYAISNEIYIDPALLP